MTEFQSEVIAEINALAGIHAIEANLADMATDVVKTNEGGLFSDTSPMGSSEAADLALDLAKAQPQKPAKPKKAAKGKQAAQAEKAAQEAAQEAATNEGMPEPKEAAPTVEEAPAAPALPTIEEAPKVAKVKGRVRSVTLVEHETLGICEALVFHPNGDVDVIDVRGETWRITGGEHA